MKFVHWVLVLFSHCVFVIQVRGNDGNSFLGSVRATRYEYRQPVQPGEHTPHLHANGGKLPLCYISRDIYRGAAERAYRYDEQYVYAC